MDFNTLQQNITQDFYKLQQIQTNITLSKEQVKDLTQQLADTEAKVQLLDSSSSVLKTLQEKLTTVHITHITKLVNRALHSVFDDEFIQYQIRLETTQQRNNNTVQFYLLTTENNQTTETLLQNNGFGIQSLVGLILQVYFILQHKQAHILFLDESLTAISTDKLPKLKQFISEVSKQYDFKFVLIAHMSELFDLADYAYNVENGQVTQVPIVTNSY